MRSTIYDVAARAGVSIATVSRVLNGRARVTPETRARVMEAVEALAYTPSPVARGLALRATGALALLFETFRDLYPGQIITGAETEAFEHGYQILAFQIQGREWDELTQVPGHADGVIISGSSGHEQFLQSLHQRGTPTVILGRSRPDLGMDGVVPDNHGGSAAAVEHLIEHGYRRIAHISGPPASAHAAARTRAYRETLEKHGLPFRPEWLVNGDYSYVSGARAVRQLLALDERPDAIFTANDQMAMGGMPAIEQEGLSIPEDIAIIGFDGLEMGEYVTPRLSSVHQPTEEAGREAVRLLLWRMANADADVREVVMPTELLVRDSCGEHADSDEGALAENVA